MDDFVTCNRSFNIVSR